MRARMIVDLPEEIQMVIRLRAIKENTTTGEIVAAAIIEKYPEELDNAARTVEENNRAKKATMDKIRDMQELLIVNHNLLTDS